MGTWDEEEKLEKAEVYSTWSAGYLYIRLRVDVGAEMKEEEGEG